jgi:hypothetical protein
MKEMKKIDYKAVEMIIDNLEEDTKELANSLLNEINFMNKTLEELKKEVETSGVITDMSQGAYSIKRSNPALNTYNQLIKNYTSCIKQLNELLPKDTGTGTDSFDEF